MGLMRSGMKTNWKKKVFFSLLIFTGAVLICYPILGFNWDRNNYNILLITIDTLRPDRLSCYSKKYINTLQIEGLANKGVVFTRAIAHNPTTLPSHTNILLGTTPLFHGVHSNSRFIVSDHFLTLAEYLKGKGYATGAFVGSYVLDSRIGLNQGFDIYDDHMPDRSSTAFDNAGYAERKAEGVIRMALAWLDKQSSKWFCWVHLWDPHVPYSSPEPFKSKFKDDPYSGEVAYVDTELGKLLDYLETYNLAENTYIVLTGDHGESLAEHGEMTHGHFAYNSTIWVPLVITGPRIDPQRIDEYVSHTDIFPTVCDLLDMEKPPFLQGISVLPLIQGKKAKKRLIYFESLGPYYDRGWAPLRGFVEENKKFIDSPIPELYDLRNDFNEKTNLSQKVNLNTYQKKLKDLEEQYTSSQKVERQKKIDPEAMEKLRSLGYVSSAAPRTKKSFGPGDDLKTLIRYEQKLYLAYELHNEGRMQESIESLKEIIREREDFDTAYISLANIYKSQRRIKEAVDIMEEGFSKNPKSYEIVSNYGSILVDAGLYNKAIEVLQKAIVLVDFDPTTWNKMGIAYMRIKKEATAQEYFQKALSLDNNNAEVLNNLGIIYLGILMRTKEPTAYTKAVQYFQKAIFIDPNYHLAHNGLGAVYKIAGKIDEAIECWHRALEIKSDYPLSIVNLGIAYFQKGDKTKSLKYLNMYIKLKGDSISPNERKKIERLIERAHQLD